MFAPNNNHEIIRWSAYQNRRYLMCCSCERLVYVRNLKCGSTFFWQNFTENFKWTQIKWEDIDWKTQRVFGHIMDPWLRRAKGITEYLHMTGLDQEFHQNSVFQNFVLNALALDEHSTSYHDYFGNLAWHIDWIPIGQNNHKQVVKQTDKLLRSYGILTSAERWNYSWTHRSESNKKDTEQLIHQLTQGRQPPEYLSWYLHDDVQLWKTITEKYDYTADNWTDTSWLDQPPRPY